MGSLLNLANAMERHFTRQSSYTGASQGGNDTGAPQVFATQTPVDGSVKFYDLTIVAANATGFTLRATPIAGSGQERDGLLEMDHTGARRWDRNNDGDTDDINENRWD
ncbi:MAG: type IV pilin protein [Magnetococcus sp. WYHC-3]